MTPPAGVDTTAAVVAVCGVVAALIYAVVEVAKLLTARKRGTVAAEATGEPDVTSGGGLSVSEAMRYLSQGHAAALVTAVADVERRASERLAAAVRRLQGQIEERDARLVELEVQVRRLAVVERSLTLAYEFIHALFRWGRAGGGDPEPVPPVGLDLPADDQPAERTP